MQKKDQLVFLSLAGIMIILYFLVFLLPSIHSDPAPAKEVICRAHLKHLLFSLILYRQTEKGWPDSNTWCDLLKPYYKDSKLLLCPGDQIGPCSYAMNEYITQDPGVLPYDLVILFESAPGWDRVGGAEDVVTDRHERPGANIAFADGHVEFVKSENIPTLRWMMEDKSVERK